MELVQLTTRIFHFLICCTCVFYEGGRGDVLSSIAQLEDVAETEEKLANVFENFIEAERIRIETLKNVLRKRKQLTSLKRNFTNSSSQDTLKGIVYGWSFVDDWGFVLDQVTFPTRSQRTGMFIHPRM